MAVDLTHDIKREAVKLSVSFDLPIEIAEEMSIIFKNVLQSISVAAKRQQFQLTLTGQSLCPSE